MKIKLLASGLLPLIMLSSTISIFAQQYTISVGAGDYDRDNTIVSFDLPKKIEAGTYRIMDFANKADVLLQVDKSSRAWFTLVSLGKGQKMVYIFDADSMVATDPNLGVRSRLDNSLVVLSTSGSDVISYYHGFNNLPKELDERYRRGGYIHPVYTPSGRVVTNHLNVNEHPHHSGIWSAWATTRFQGRTPDFWNVHGNTGRVDVVEGTLDYWQGAVQGGFKSEHQFMDLSSTNGPVEALRESWSVRVYSMSNGFNIFDVIITQNASTLDTLYLPEYRYGGVGFRGHADWDKPDNCNFLTSEGDGRDGHGSRAKWVHIGGAVDGDQVGITIMDHPSNYRFPQTVRIHPTEPFFNYAPQQLGDMAIAPGEAYQVRYRYVTYDGNPLPDELQRLWNDFAYPPIVTVTEK